MSAATTAPALGIGSRVWRFNVNRRIYDKRSGWAPIYREHFTACEIMGETRDSWIVGARYECGHDNELHAHKERMRKKERANERKLYYTDVEMEDDIFKHEHAYKISEHVRRVDVAKLRQIAELIGYEVKE